MKNSNDPLFKQGQKAFRDNKSWRDLQGSHYMVFQGYDFEQRISRQGFDKLLWNLPAGYKTSADLRTLFV